MPEVPITIPKGILKKVFLSISNTCSLVTEHWLLSTFHPVPTLLTTQILEAQFTSPILDSYIASVTLYTGVSHSPGLILASGFLIHVFSNLYPLCLSWLASLWALLVVSGYFSLVTTVNLLLPII